ncbi:BTAD domain-containing putative transcriptional regulator [Pseudonocardia sp. TRM90224]|uniref:BTAD domain-containing putative transcriptional regulator n=1 Tax=Pseudonocardia sp. TRM90224 TaxID=2812678 RepID=UPI001E42714F|nr:BTAD domain-containing putative transcriptional regulator [Pseudonocardia sp. TRM90224]
MLFAVLGPLEVSRDDGTPVEIGGPKVRALLAALLREPGAVIGFDRLVDAVYADAPPAGATNALQSQVTRLRQALGAAELVERHPTGYRLAISPEQVDAHRFEQLLTQARSDPAPATVLRAALALWRAAASDQPDLEELRVEAVERLAEVQLDDEATLPLLRTLVRQHPLRERPRTLLVRALHRAGRATEALAEFETARRTLADELGTDPGPELADAHLDVLRTPSVAVVRTLPLQLTSFIGREQELGAVGRLLAEHRIVTVTGPGGAGKTRLASQLAEQHDDDVCFVALAPLDGASDLALAVLDTLGLREGGLPGRRPASEDRPSIDRLVAAISGRKLLLVLDNCEHVVDAAAQLAHAVLAACAGIRVLATSREALRVRGEVVWPVPRLAVPEGPAADPLAFPAVRLFAERAAAVRPGFVVTAANAEVVVDICRALDGQPLAIELAAARVSSLPLDEIAARLAGTADRFTLLSRGPRTGEERHRTLAAVVEWSWQLLDDEERRFAARFTVFAGGATLDAATAVCGDGDVLAGLVDKSLIEVGADGRYRMLETIRAFCLQQPGHEAAGRAHAEHFLRIAALADPHLRTADQLDWLAMLHSEHDNLVAAVRWTLRNDEELGLRLFSALAQYWWLAGRKSEGAALAMGFVEQLRFAELQPQLHEEYLAVVSHAATGGVPSDALREPLAHAHKIVNRLSDVPRQPFLMLLWGAVRGLPRSDDLAQQLLMRDAVAASHPWSGALSRLGHGILAMYRAEMDKARVEITEAVTAFRSIGDRWALALALSELAALRSWLGEWDESLALTDEAMTLMAQTGATEETAELRSRRADTFRRSGDLGAAAAEFRHSLDIARHTAAPDMASLAVAGLADVARQEGRTAEAAELYRDALAGCPSGLFSSEEIRARIHLGLSALALTAGNRTAAEEQLRGAVASAMRTSNLHVVALVAEATAGVALLDGDAERAATLLGTGHALRGIPIAGDPDRARLLDECTSRLGATRCAVAYARGSSLSRTQALTSVGVEPSALGA